MTAPIDSPEHLAELWNYAETRTDIQHPEIEYDEFRGLIRQISPECRKVLEEMWRAQPRRQEDGTFGDFVTDHLWLVFSFRDSLQELNDVFPPSYLDALCNALGLNDAQRD